MSAETAGVDDAAMMNYDPDNVGSTGTGAGINERPVQPRVRASGYATIGSHKDVRGVFRIKSDSKPGGLVEIG